MYSVRNLKGPRRTSCWCEGDGLALPIVVDPDRCVGCGSCIRACAYGVLELIDDMAYPVRPSECRGCGDCVKACEQGAIQVLQVARGKS